MDNNKKRLIMIEKHIKWLNEYKQKAFELMEEGNAIIDKIEKKQYRKSEKIVDLFYEASEKYNRSSISWDTFVTHLFSLDKSYWPQVEEEYSFQSFIDNLIKTYYCSGYYFEKTAESIKVLLKKRIFEANQQKRFKFVLPQILGKSIFKYKELYYIIFGRKDQKEDSYKKIRNIYKFEIDFSKEDLDSKVLDLYKRSASSWLDLVPFFHEKVKHDEEGITYGYVADCYLSLFLWLKKQNRTVEKYLDNAITYYSKAGQFEARDQRRLTWNFADREINDLFPSMSKESERASYLKKLKDSL